MNNKVLFLTLFSCYNIIHFSANAQSNDFINVLDSLNSIIYIDEAANNMVGVKVGGVYWAPVNIGSSYASNQQNKESSFFSHPKSNPCPRGWRLPTQDEILKLQQLSRTRKVEFDYDRKGLNIKSDDGASTLFIPANGVMSSSGKLSGEGLSGSLWSSDTLDGDTGYNLHFNGGELSIGYSLKDSKKNVRCVCEM